jgi:hypothetical protein
MIIARGCMIHRGRKLAGSFEWSTFLECGDLSPLSYGFLAKIPGVCGLLVHLQISRCPDSQGGAGMLAG